ncbi:MAG: DUF4276 family protein [Desulfarculus sp.]|nr:DUF4276 family protein [Desulfarculus sp.]
MRVVVYLEGPSDVYAMKALLKPLVEEKRRQGVGIEFTQAGKGDAKAYLLTRVPVLAAVELAKRPDTAILVIPDLYPMGKASFKDGTPEELEQGLRGNLKAALKANGQAYSPDLDQRFKVFCFKHDLEALLLAAPQRLANRLGLKSLKPAWKLPVEDQNHEHPPKQVVQALFRKHGKNYDQKVDAPLILAGADYRAIAQACPQCFQPLVEFLESRGAPA